MKKKFTLKPLMPCALIGQLANLIAAVNNDHTSKTRLPYFCGFIENQNNATYFVEYVATDVLAVFKNDKLICKITEETYFTLQS